MDRSKILTDILKTVLIAYFISLFLLKFVLLPCEVEGSSMIPNLHGGDFGYSFIISKNLDLDRFDIVIINVDDDKLLVKRLIGLPNDHIQYKDNVLYINGEKYDEPFIREGAYTNDLEIQLGENEYYCLGDNRNSSNDSRYYGAFSKQDIKSSHVFVFYPFEDFGYKR